MKHQLLSLNKTQDTKHMMATRLISKKKVSTPNGIKIAAGKQYKLKNGLRILADTADSIPSLKTTLVSNSKLADAGYVTVYNDEEVNVYDTKTTKIRIMAEAVMAGF